MTTRIIDNGTGEVFETEQTENQLVIFDNAYHALMEAKTIDEVKEIRDKAEALRLYLKQQGQGLEMQNTAAEIKLRAERRAGELLTEMDKNKGNAGNISSINGYSGGNTVLPPDNEPPTLSDIGLTKMQSSRFQTIASLPEETFEEYIASTKARKEELTSVGVRRLGRRYKKQQQAETQKQEAKEVEKELPETDHEDCIYQDETTSLWVGDAANLHFLADNSIDLIVTSPPYNIGEKNGNGRVLWGGVEYSDHNDKMPENKYQDWQVEVLNELYRVMRPGGSLFYNHKIRNRKGSGIHPLQWILRSEWNFRQQIVWDRGSTHNKEMSYFWPHDELIFWLTKGTKNIYLSPEGARMSTIWRFGFETNSDHPAPFPLELPARCIRAASRPGDIVLDPFGGSMTTCRAAKDLGRQAIGVDISKVYIVKYAKRLAQGVLL